jgi:hypothetical protein
MVVLLIDRPIVVFSQCAAMLRIRIVFKLPRSGLVQQ